MKKTTIRCPYCGARATLRPSSVVYGERAKPGGYLYICDRYPKRPHDKMAGLPMDAGQICSE